MANVAYGAAQVFATLGDESDESGHGRDREAHPEELDPPEDEGKGEDANEDKD